MTYVLAIDQGPRQTYEPVWSADRAAEHMHRWKQAANAALAQKETRR